MRPSGGGHSKPRSSRGARPCLAPYDLAQESSRRAGNHRSMSPIRSPIERNGTYRSPHLTDFGIQARCILQARLADAAGRGIHINHLVSQRLVDQGPTLAGMPGLATGLPARSLLGWRRTGESVRDRSLGAIAGVQAKHRLKHRDACAQRGPLGDNCGKLELKRLKARKKLKLSRSHIHPHKVWHNNDLGKRGAERLPA